MYIENDLTEARWTRRHRIDHPFVTRHELDHALCNPANGRPACGGETADIQEKDRAHQNAFPIKYGPPIESGT